MGSSQFLQFNMWVPSIQSFLKITVASPVSQVLIWKTRLNLVFPTRNEDSQFITKYVMRSLVHIWVPPALLTFWAPLVSQLVKNQPAM